MSIIDYVAILAYFHFNVFLDQNFFGLLQQKIAQAVDTTVQKYNEVTVVEEKNDQDVANA